MKIKLILIFALSFCLAQNAVAQDKPEISETDKIRISEAYRLGNKLSNEIWKNWNSTTFSTLFILPENEFLIRNSAPSEDFSEIGYEKKFKSKVYRRKRQFNPSFLATFPAVGGISTIVIGKAENTLKPTSTDWVVTMLHEHFHQMQDSQPNIYAEIDKLDLSGGDQTGMWMLDYEFPYGEKNINNQFNDLSRKLAEMLETVDKKELSVKLNDYLSARKKFQNSLNEKDYRYFSFQLWKEGVARYTEYRVAKLAAKKYKPTKKFRRLPDYKSFGLIASELKKEMLNELKSSDLERNKRVSFYAFGAGEALILDRVNPDWKNKYWTENFYLEKYFSKNDK